MTRQIQHTPIHSPRDFTEEYIEALKDIAIVQMEASKRLRTLQIEAIHAAFAENVRQLRSLLDNTRGTGTTLAQWSARSRKKLQEFVKTGGDWAEIASRSITETNGLAQTLFANSTTGHVDKKSQKIGTHVERRVSASVIAFPERRAEALASKSGSREQLPEKKRKTA